MLLLCSWHLCVLAPQPIDWGGATHTKPGVKGDTLIVLCSLLPGRNIFCRSFLSNILTYSHCHVWMACLLQRKETGCISWSLGHHIWPRPPYDGECVCSQMLLYIFNPSTFWGLGIIALIASSHWVLTLNYSKAVFQVLTKSRSKAAWLQLVLLSSEIPTGSDPPRMSHVLVQGLLLTRGKRGTGL